MFNDSFPIDDIIIPENLPRKIEIDQSFEELKESIKLHGVMSPIVLSQSENKYFLVAGLRRMIACQDLGLDTIPAIIIETDAQQSLVLSITENIIRKDLTPLQEAVAYHKLETTHRLNRKEISRLIGKSQAYVTGRIQILSWPEVLKDALDKNIIAFSVAREMADIKDIEYLRRVIIDAEEFGISARKANFVTNEWKKAVIQQKPLQPGEIPEYKQEIYMENCDVCKKPTPPAQFTIIRVCPACATQGK